MHCVVEVISSRGTCTPTSAAGGARMGHRRFRVAVAGRLVKVRRRSTRRVDVECCECTQRLRRPLISVIIDVVVRSVGCRRGHRQEQRHER